VTRGVSGGEAGAESEDRGWKEGAIYRAEWTSRGGEAAPALWGSTFGRSSRWAAPRAGSFPWEDPGARGATRRAPRAQAPPAYPDSQALAGGGGKARLRSPGGRRRTP
jgi:hypothetical protein